MIETYNWVILEITYEGDTYYKVLSQVGIGLNDWRINSGITEVKQDDYYYYFFGSSGSCYKCSKAAEGLSRTTNSLFTKIEHAAKIVPAKEMSENYLL